MKLSPILSNVTSCLKSVWSIFKDRSNKLRHVIDEQIIEFVSINHIIILFSGGCEARDSFTRVTYQILSDLVTRIQHCPESEMVPAHVHCRTTTYTCNTKLHIYMYTCSVHVMIVTEEYHSLLRNRFSILESNTRKIEVRPNC